MTNDIDDTDGDDAYAHMPEWAAHEMQWADRLLGVVHELAFLPDLAGYEDAAGYERADYALRVRRHGEIWRIHGFADVLWAGGQPDWAPYYWQHPETYPHKTYPGLRTAIDEGLPAAMAAHTAFVHHHLRLKREAMDRLSKRKETGDG